MSDERYQQRQQRVKEKVDARVAQAQDERGIICLLYTSAMTPTPNPNRT